MHLRKNEQLNESIKKSIAINVLDFIDLHPSAVKNLQVARNSNKIFVSRENYSEVYCYNQNAQIADNIIINQLLRQQPCEYIFQVNKVLVLLLPYELKTLINGKLKSYPFTTQLLSIKLEPKSEKLYTFHKNSCLLWEISNQDGINMKFLQPQEQPYRITQEGNIEGIGKKIKPHIKGITFTVLEESQCKNYLFVGTDSGQLYIFETKFMTVIKKIQRHEASILAIKSVKNTVFFSGSDSKISSLKLSQQKKQWLLSLQVRGQSHDITTLAITNNNKYLISAGLTTDLCFYELTDKIQFSTQVKKIQPLSKPDNWSHKVSYSSQNLVELVDKYLIVNLMSSFQIWSVKAPISLIVKYQQPIHKNIKQIKTKYWDNKLQSLLIIVVTQYETVTWVFDEEKGLLKHSTITNSYNLLQSFGDLNSVLTLKNGYILQKLNYKTGRITELAQTGIMHPTQLKINYNQNGNYNIMIGSKYTKDIEIYQFSDKNKLKDCQLLVKLQLSQYYQFIDFYGEKIMIKYFNQFALKAIDCKKNNFETEIISLPTKKIRYGGWIHKQMCSETQKNKVFWYGVSEGKIMLVSNMRPSIIAKKKKIRVKQFPRIGCVVPNDNQQKQWDLGIIPLNFRTYIKQKVMNPVIVKKIE